MASVYSKSFLNQFTHVLLHAYDTGRHAAVWLALALCPFVETTTAQMQSKLQTDLKAEGTTLFAEAHLMLLNNAEASQLTAVCTQQVMQSEQTKPKHASTAVLQMFVNPCRTPRMSATQ